MAKAELEPESVSHSLESETTTAALQPRLLSQCGEERAKNPGALPKFSETDSEGTVWVTQLACKCGKTGMTTSLAASS